MPIRATCDIQMKIGEKNWIGYAHIIIPINIFSWVLNKIEKKFQTNKTYYYDVPWKKSSPAGSAGQTKQTLINSYNLYLPWS